MTTDAYKIMFPDGGQDDPDVVTVRRALSNIAEVCVKARKTIKSIAKRRGMTIIRQGLTTPQRQRAVLLMTAAKTMIQAIGEQDPGDPPDNPDPISLPVNKEV